MIYQQGLVTLESRARRATVALWVFVAVSALTAGGELLEAVGVLDIQTDLGAVALAVSLTYLSYTLVFVVSIVLVGLWIHRAHANLRESGADELAFSPGWAVGWYFVPFANLVMPFKAMRELWNASRGEHDFFGGPAAAPELKAWWAAWIVGNVLGVVGSRILLLGEGSPGSTTVGNAFSAGGTVCVLVAAVLLRTIVTRVTAMQRGGLAAAGVFA